MQSAPFIRLTVPFIIGIYIQYVWPSALLFEGAVSGAVIAFLIGIVTRNPAVRFRLRPAFGLFVFLFFFAAGIFSVLLRQQQESPLPSGYTGSIARIDENSGERGKSIACTATIKHFIDSAQQYHPVEEKVFLYFYPNEYARSLIQGNYIIFTPNLSPIRNSSNPESFDYASYARRQGILYSQYLPPKAWRLLGYSPEKSLKEKALQYRQRLINLISDIPLGDEELALLNALLLGNTALIAHEQRESFSSAGLSHILAVSGLHTGIIWWLLSGLFYPLVWMRIPRLRYLFIIGGLWIYAFVTGLSPSVIRACIMATFILTGYLIGRKGNLFNSLFASAFFMLLYQPYYLFDIGFQLSYLAVLSIALFYPSLFRIISGKSFIWNKIARILAVSLAAQLGTLPVSAYYFHSIPLLFLITNLLVIPILPATLCCGILSVIITAIPLQLSWLYRLTDGLLHFIISITDYTTAIPGHAWQVWVEPRHLVLYFGLLFFTYHIFILKHKWHFVFGLTAVLLFLLYDTFVPLKKVSNGWIIYQDNTHTVLHFIDSPHNFLYSTDSVADYEQIRRISQNFRIKHHLSEPVVASDTLNSRRLYIRRPFILFDNERILILDSTAWKNKISPRQLPLDYLVVTPEYKGRIADLLPLFSIKQVIIPSNITYFKSYGLERECRKLRIPCHAIRNDGAWTDFR